MKWVLTLLTVLLWPSLAIAQDACGPSAVCVPEKDMKVFVKVLRDKQCQLNEDPQFELDPIQIVVDKSGRVFYTGADPKPYKLRMTWCNYEVEAEGKVSVIAAMQKPPLWGFRLRPKAYMGILPSEVAYSSEEPRDIGDFMDAGVMVDFLYYDWVNLNGAVGYRSLGAGVGIDLTENFGLAAAYGITWGKWHHNLVTSFWFGF